MTNDPSIIQMPENAALNEKLLPPLVSEHSIRIDTDGPLRRTEDPFGARKYELWRIRINVRSPLTVTEERVATGADKPLPLGCGRLYADWEGPSHGRLPTTTSAASTPRQGGSKRLSVAATFWVNACRLELASVASFNRTSMELMSLGAPLALIGRVQKAALEETRHVHSCAAIARHFGASENDIAIATTALAALPPRTLSRAEYGMLVVHEAVAQEALGAQLLSHMAEHCDDEVLANRLGRLAQDELRHARLACDTVRWLVGNDGMPAVMTSALALLDSLALRHPVYPARVGRGALPTRRTLRQAHQASRALLQTWLAPPCSRIDLPRSVTGGLLGCS